MAESKQKQFTTEQLLNKATRFKYYSEALYLTDVSFQQYNTVTGLMKETDYYVSGKHHLNDYRTEISVLPNRLAIGVSRVYPGSVPDIDVFQNTATWHNTGSRKHYRVTKF